MAVEKLQNLEQEKVHNESLKRISRPEIPMLGSLASEMLYENNRDIDYNERGHIMDQSDILDEDEERKQVRPPEVSKLTLHDELGMLNFEENDFGETEENMIFENKTGSSELMQDKDIELGQIFNNDSDEDARIRQVTPRETEKQLNDNPNDNVESPTGVTSKDLIIKDLKKKIEIEIEIKENYQRKSVEYMIDYIKAEKRRKEIEVYLGIKKRKFRSNLKGIAIIVAIVIVIIFVI